MAAFLARRLLLALGLLAVAAAAAFLLLLLVPGDPAVLVLAERGRTEPPPPAEVARLRGELGLDRPAPERFLRWLGGAVQGDLGRSWRTGARVADDLGPRLRRTSLLAVFSTALAVLLSLAWGLAAATRPGGGRDRLLLLITSLLASTPVFVLGLLLVLCFGLGLGVLPAAGDETPAHFVLPVLALGLAHAAVPARVLRRSLLVEIGRTYAVAARARGASEEAVVHGHALRNAAVPYVMLVALALRGLLGGSVLIEAVFDLRGVGTWLVDAVSARDVPAVLAGVLLFVAATVAVNLAADLVSAWIDPRIRFAREAA